MEEFGGLGEGCSRAGLICLYVDRSCNDLTCCDSRMLSGYISYLCIVKIQ